MEHIHIRSVSSELPPPSSWMPYLEEALEANWHTNFGPVCRRFERRLETMYARPGECVVSTSNATSGLSACLIAGRVSGPVLCPAFTFQATAGAILGARCTPVIIDTDAHKGVVPPAVLDDALRETNAKAAIVLSPFGITTDFQEHARICEAHGALLIIDNAAGLGIDRSDPKTSATGDCVREVFSLHATKPFGIGEGGAVFAPSGARGALESALNFGLTTHTRDGHSAAPYWGINGKLAEVAAAIGLAVADTMASRVEARQEMAQRWFDTLGEFPVSPLGTSRTDAPWQCFPILMPSTQTRDRFVERAEQQGIELRKYYFPSLGHCSGMQRIGDCANAADLAARAVVLPVRSWMPAAEQGPLMKMVTKCLSESLA